MEYSGSAMFGGIPIPSGDWITESDIACFGAVLGINQRYCRHLLKQLCRTLDPDIVESADMKIVRGRFGLRSDYHVRVNWFLSRDLRSLRTGSIASRVLTEYQFWLKHALNAASLSKTTESS